jgi:hypothetical protein
MTAGGLRKRIGEDTFSGGAPAIADDIFLRRRDITGVITGIATVREHG